MNAGTRAVFAASLILSACALAPQRDALTAATRYSDALNARDYDTAIELTDPEVLSRIPPSELRTLMAAIFNPTGQGAHDEVRSVSTEFSDSVGMHYFVANARTGKASDSLQTETESYYIVTSRDFGRTWRVVDIGCVDERWIRGIAPGWNGIPTAPPQTFRVIEVNASIKPLN